MLISRSFFRLQSKLGMEDSFSSESSDKSPKKIHQVSRTGDNPTKITIKTTTVDSGTSSSAASGGTSSLNQTEGSQSLSGGSGHHHGHHHGPGRPSRKRKHKEFASPSGEAMIHVDTDGGKATNGEAGNGPNASSNKNSSSVNIHFDPNTKRLWQDLHYPYGSYTSFLR
jgi:hypothetical protein